MRGGYMTSMWSADNDRDYCSQFGQDDPEDLCPHGKPFTCEACYEEFQEWARQAAEQNRARELATPDEYDTEASLP